MSATSRDKGDVLETAVAAIERTILAATPELREKTFLIESKKIVKVADVHHEIDIFVTIDLGHGYQSVYIFECKNWQDAVGKNEVIILSAKINAMAAAKGYLIAKSFTKDAHAQAGTDSRISLITASEHDPTSVPIPFAFHAINTVPQHVEVTFRRPASSSGLTDDLPMESTQLILDGNSVPLSEYVKVWSEKLCAADVCKFRTEKLPKGDYERTATEERLFDLGRLLIDDLPEHLSDTFIQVLFIFISVVGHSVLRAPAPDQLLGLGVVHVDNESSFLVVLLRSGGFPYSSESSPTPSSAHTVIEGLKRPFGM